MVGVGVAATILTACTRLGAPGDSAASPSPGPGYRDRFLDLHGIPAERRYASWQELITVGQLAPALVTTTPDLVRLASAVARVRVAVRSTAPDANKFVRKRCLAR